MAGARAGVEAAGVRERGVPWFQVGAVGLCLLLGLLMVVNNQMGGEAMWFWYATVFGRGVKLYSGLHTPLQPLFVLLTSAWMRMFGVKLWVTQIPSLVEAGLMGVLILLILRERLGMPDWQKALVLLGTFCLTVSGTSYRLDDYHVLTENLILAVVLCLLRAERADRTEAGAEWVLGLAATTGVLAGLAFVTRVTDGAALTSSSVVCLLLMLRRRRLLSCAVFAAAMVLTVLAVVGLTGDGMGIYLSSTIFKAAKSKGGTGSIFAAPFHGIWNIGKIFWIQSKQVFLRLLVMVAAGVLVARRWRPGVRYLVAIQVGLMLALLLLTGRVQRYLALRGSVIWTVVLVLTPLLYVLTPVVLARLGMAERRRREFDRREVLVVLALAEWMSFSAGAAGEPLTNYYAPIAVFLLLLAVVQPFGRARDWMQPTVVSVMALLALSTVTEKWIRPYWWQNYLYGPMFENRVVFHHPVYGVMYVDRDLFRFAEQVCRDIGAKPGENQPALLSLPYPYPNYFCVTPPWHDYVQTFFDTSTRAQVEGLMRELEEAPPEWIVYQRQLNILKGAERLYNHGQPLAQRALDEMIFAKIQSGQWRLVDRSDYLGMVDQGGGWYIIRTRP